MPSRSEAKSSLLPEGTLVAERYVIQRRVGSGGMGVVFEALDRELDRPVALKVIRAKHVDCAESQGRLRREIEAMARIVHPNVIRLFDVGLDHIPPFFTMQLVSGIPLSSRLRGEPLSPRLAARYCEGLAKGLQALHDANILHRDIKPDNVMVTVSDDAILMDLGLVLFGDKERTQITRAGRIVGTFRYLPPEIFAEMPPTPASDVYQLGRVLFHTLTGADALEGAGVDDVLSGRVFSQVEALRNADLAPAFKDLVSACLAKSPEDRPQSAVEVAQRLRRLIDGPSAALAPPRPVERSESTTSPPSTEEAQAKKETPSATKREGRPTRFARRIALASFLLIACAGASLLWKRYRVVPPRKQQTLRPVKRRLGLLPTWNGPSEAIDAWLSQLGRLGHLPPSQNEIGKELVTLARHSEFLEEGTRARLYRVLMEMRIDRVVTEARIFAAYGRLARQSWSQPTEIKKTWALVSSQGLDCDDEPLQSLLDCARTLTLFRALGITPSPIPEIAKILKRLQWRKKAEELAASSTSDPWWRMVALHVQVSDLTMVNRARKIHYAVSALALAHDLPSGNRVVGHKLAEVLISIGARLATEESLREVFDKTAKKNSLQRRLESLLTRIIVTIHHLTPKPPIRRVQPLVLSKANLANTLGKYDNADTLLDQIPFDEDDLPHRSVSRQFALIRAKAAYRRLENIGKTPRALQSASSAIHAIDMAIRQGGPMTEDLLMKKARLLYVSGRKDEAFVAVRTLSASAQSPSNRNRALEWQAAWKAGLDHLTINRLQVRSWKVPDLR